LLIIFAKKIIWYIGVYLFIWPICSHQFCSLAGLQKLQKFAGRAHFCGI